MASKKLEIILTGDPKSAVRAFGEVSDAADGTGSKFSAMAGVATAALAAVVAAIAAVGFGLLSLGGQFFEATSTIRIGTGATGAALEGLRDDFEAVVSDVPASFDDASVAIADLNTRLGLSGPPLQAMAEQFLDLSRITKTDVATNVKNLTRLFGDWSVASEDQASTLDEIFRASQATGISIDSLSAQVVSFGAPLRGLGFGLEESLAMLSKWEKEGVNVENVLGAMKKAYGSFSDEYGSRAPEEFRKFMAELEAAPDSAAAASIAIERLGVRNGPDFAAAVQEGRFQYGDLLAQIEGGSDTIEQAASDTEGWQQKLEVLKNRALVGLEPIATKVFDAVSQAVDAVGPYFDQFSAWISEKLPIAAAYFDDTIRPAVERLGATFAPVFETIGSLVSWVSGMFSTNLGDSGSGAGGTLERLRETGQKLWDALSSIFDLIGQLVGNIADAWREHGDTVMKYVQGFVDGLLGVFGGLFDAIRGIVETVGALLRGDWEGVWNGLQAVFFGVVDAIKSAFSGLWDGLLAILTGAGALLQQIFGGLWQSIVDAAVGAWDWIYSKVEAVIGFVIGLGQGLWNAYSAVWSGILNAALGVWDWIYSKVESVIGFVVGLGQQVVGIYLGVWSTIRDGAAAAFSWVWEKAEGLLGFFTALPGRMWDAVRGLFGGIAQAFGNAINWVIEKWNGLELTLPSVDTPFGTIGGFTLGTPDLPLVPIPAFHTGGTYRAPRPGGEGFALLRDGETVSTPGGGAAGGGGFTIENLSINVQDTSGNFRAFAREAVDELVVELRRREIALS